MSVADLSDQDRKCPVDIPPIGGRYDTMMLDFAAIISGEPENPFGDDYELAV